MLPLILTVLCSTTIALILKYNDSKKGAPITLLTGNYFVAAIISFLFLISDAENQLSIQTLLFGLLLAVLFVFSFFSFAKAVNVAGTALASISSRLSVVVPVTLSIIVFKEFPSEYQIVGFAFTIVTIYAFYFSLKKLPGGKLKLKEYFYVGAVLVGIGINDFSMKIFQQWRPSSEKPFFIFMIFFGAFIFTLLYMIVKGLKFDKKVLIRGGILGIPNIFSTFFLLGALAKLPGIIVYPISNISIILLTALLAAIIWAERLNKGGVIALVSGIIAIVFLGL